MEMSWPISRNSRPGAAFRMAWPGGPGRLLRDIGHDISICVRAVSRPKRIGLQYAMAAPKALNSWRFRRLPFVKDWLARGRPACNNWAAVAYVSECGRMTPESLQN